MKKLGLYIHIPFCVKKCNYCDFNSYGCSYSYEQPYFAALFEEIKKKAKGFSDYVCDTVYIGGGTPLALGTGDLERVLKATAPIFAQNERAEYTVEAGRPDVFTEDKLKLLKDYGVNRICINPQTFSDETLQKIGRKHTVTDFYNAYALSQKYGFIVNIDLIAGLTDESVDNFLDGVNKATALQADNITVHCLSLKSGAKLKEEISYLKNDFVADMVASSRQILSENGYMPYYMYRQKYQVGNNENVGWTKPNKACVYNVDIMEETTDNLAVGANSVSKRVFFDNGKITRFASQKDLKTYIEKIDEIIENKNKFFE